jgi:hypothetical protein
VNPKILIAFAAGALIASGIVYIAVAPDQVATPSPITAQVPIAAQSKPTDTTPVAQVQPPPRVIPAPVEIHRPSAPAPQPAADSTPMHDVSPAPPPATSPREKPSPLRPRVRHEQPLIFARNENPLQEPAASPRPAQVAKPSQPTPVPAAPPVIAAPVVVTPPAPGAASLPEATSPAQPQVPPMHETRTPNTVTIHTGTILAVKIGETISSVRNRAGDGFVAALDRPLVIDGFVIAERGSHVEGRVVEAQHPAGMNNLSDVGVEITQLSTSDGQSIRVHTATFKRESGNFPGGDFRIQEPITITERLQ